MGTHKVTSCSNMSRWHVVVTNCSVCTGEFLWKSLLLQQNFVIATSCTNSVWFDFLWLVGVTKIFTKILQYTWSDLSLWPVASLCCCNYSPDLYAWSDLLPVICCRDVLLQIVALCVPTFNAWEWRINLLIFFLDLPAQTNTHWTKTTQRKT